MNLFSLILESGWIGFFAGSGALLAVILLFYVGHLLEKKGILKNYSRGLGRGILHAEAVLSPSKAHVIEAQEKQQREDDEQGGPDGAKTMNRVK